MTGPMVVWVSRIGEEQDTDRMELVAPADGLVTVRVTDATLCPSHTVLCSLETGDHRCAYDLRRIDPPAPGQRVRAGDRIVVGAQLEDLQNQILCMRFGSITFEVVLH